MSAVLSLAGVRATRAALTVPFAGVWLADVELDAVVALAGAVEVRLGPLALQGTVYAPRSGTFGLRARYRVLGGAGGWQRTVESRPYHNDLGLRLSDVLSTTAEEVGERITLLPGVDGRLDVDYARHRGTAQRVLEHLLPSTPWWVSYDGVTRAGARASSEIASAYDLLDYDPVLKVAHVACDDPGAIVVGSILRGRLDRPVVVRHMELAAQATALRMKLWARDLA